MLWAALSLAWLRTMRVRAWHLLESAQGRLLAVRDTCIAGVGGAPAPPPPPAGRD